MNGESVRFLCDHDVFAVTVDYFRNLGHDVVTAAQLGKASAKDFELLRAA